MLQYLHLQQIQQIQQILDWGATVFAVFAPSLKANTRYLLQYLLISTPFWETVFAHHMQPASPTLPPPLAPPPAPWPPPPPTAPPRERVGCATPAAPARAHQLPGVRPEQQQQRPQPAGGESAGGGGRVHGARMARAHLGLRPAHGPRAVARHGGDWPASTGKRGAH